MLTLGGEDERQRAEISPHCSVDSLSSVSKSSSALSSLANGNSLVPFFTLNPTELPRWIKSGIKNETRSVATVPRKNVGNYSHLKQEYSLFPTCDNDSIFNGDVAHNVDLSSCQLPEISEQIGYPSRSKRCRNLLKSYEGKNCLYGTYSIIDMKNLLEYIDSCGNMNGEISLDEFDMAFRKFKHLSLHSEEDSRAKALLSTVLKVIHLENTTPGKWFYSCWNGDVLKDPTTQTWPEFKDNLNTLFRKNFVEEILNRDFLLLQRFMDPMAEFDSSNNLDESEFISAFKRISMPESNTEQMKSAKVLLEHIDTYITVKQLRIRDLFNSWGKGKCLDLHQLSMGVKKILRELNVRKISGNPKECSKCMNESEGGLMRSWNYSRIKCRVKRTTSSTIIWKSVII